MRDNPVFFVVDLTEIFDKYIKEISALLEQGIQIRELVSDIILDSKRYVNLLTSANNSEIIRDSVVRYIVNNTGATKLPYRDSIEYLKQFNLDGLVADVLSFLMETFFKPIDVVLKQKQETNFKIGIPRFSNNFIISVPVWFGQEVLLMDKYINV